MDLLTSLPPEILSTVFEFLPLEDRKNVRLTCQSFRNACNRTDIIKREKFVFHFGFVGSIRKASDRAYNLIYEKIVPYVDFVDDDNDASPLVQYIGQCDRLRSAVEFRAVDLRLLPLFSLWEKLGERITSLFVDDCIVNDEIIAEIFLHCSELVQIHLNVISDAVLFGSGSTSLDKLIARRIERPKLRSFKLFTRRSPSDDAFQKIFKICPNIRTFGRDQYSPSRHDWRFNSSSIELPPSIENFIYHTYEYSSWTVPHIRQPSLRYNELEVTLTIFNDQEMFAITEFLSSQTELRRLNLVILRSGWDRSHLVKTVLFYIFKKCLKLESLRFHTTCGIKLSELECADLVATVRTFKSLDLSFTESSYGPPTSEHALPSIEYHKLTHLRWDFGPYCATQFQTEILRRCRSLRSLCLRNVDDETLKFIFRDLTELKELSLDCFGCLDMTCMEEYSLDRLQNLEFLDLFNIPNLLHSSNIFWRRRQHVGSSSVVAIVSKLNCPELKVFLCAESMQRDVVRHLSKKDTVKVLRTLAEKTPQLETLKLSSSLLIEEYHIYYGEFKKLRHLVRANLPFDDSHMTDAYLKLFEACPSLMYVVNDRGCESNAHFYHRTTGLLRTHYDKSPELLCKTLNVPAYS